MDNHKTFRQRLIKVRQVKKWSQSYLAKRASLNASSISHFENGRRLPSFDNLVKLSAALIISIDFLIGAKKSELVNGNVMARPEDWPKIRELEHKLLIRRD